MSDTQAWPAVRVCHPAGTPGTTAEPSHIHIPRPSRVGRSDAVSPAMGHGDSALGGNLVGIE